MEKEEEGAKDGGFTKAARNNTFPSPEKVKALRIGNTESAQFPFKKILPPPLFREEKKGRDENPPYGKCAEPEKKEEEKNSYP